MPLRSDFTLSRYEDVDVLVETSPPIPVGGMNLQFVMARRFGSLPYPTRSGEVLITKTCATGFGAGQSGISVIDSGQGVLAVSFASVETSGLRPGPYACKLFRNDPGNVTLLWEGYMVLLT